MPKQLKWGFARGGSGVPKNGKNGGFWAKKGRKSVIFDPPEHKIFKNRVFFPSIAPRLKELCPLWENPPIYTVLNAAFSAPRPPSGDTVVGHHSPAASHGLPEPPPAILAPQASPREDGTGFSCNNQCIILI